MPHTTSVALNRCGVKRHAATEYLRQSAAMGERKKREPASALQRVFLKRVYEEMARQGLIRDDGQPNTAALERRDPKLKQRTAYGVLREYSDPSLETVENFALALGIHPAHRLLVDPDPYVAQRTQDQPPGRKYVHGGDISQFPPSKTGRKAKQKGDRKE